jgi:hypothetical protein
MTKFEMAVNQAEMGKISTPTVSYGSKQVDYFHYQLSVHHYNLRLMAIGIRFRGIKLAEMKDYYGLKGRSAADVLPQFEKIIETYKSKQQLN